MAAVNLRCGQCGYDNEPERVYCHNCGAKLDRTLLPKAEDDKNHESPDKARKRIKKMTNPGSNPVLREFKALLSTLAWGAVVAALYLISRAPEGAPDPKAMLNATRLVQSELMETLESPTPRAIAFSQDDLNQALKQSLRGEKSGVIPGMKFDRAWVKLTPGTARMNIQQSLGGYPLYSAAEYKVEMKDGKFAPVLTGGSYGRLPVHPAAMQYLDFPFKKLWAAMKRERDQIAKLQSIAITEGQVSLVTKGAAAR